MLNNLSFLLQTGKIKKPVYLQFVLGILGGMQATVNSLVFLVNSAREIIGDNFVWSVCAAGRHQFTMCNLALLMGGNTRVGLEDNLYLEKRCHGHKQRRAGGKNYPYWKRTRPGTGHTGGSEENFTFKGDREN